MKVRRGIRKAFTLVEILIVVVILGILAAIVVPQFTNAANEARGGNIDTQESTIQNQLELYAARNNGNYPDLVGAGEATWQEMVDDGYFKTAPANPFCSEADDEFAVVAAVGATIAAIEAEAAAADPAAGAWVYSQALGVLRAARGGN